MAIIGLFPAEVDEEAAPVLRVLLDPVVQRLDLLLVQETQYPFLQLTRSLAGDDLHEGRLLGDRLVDDAAEGAIDIESTVIDVMEVELELHRTFPGSPSLAT